jgi:hypothetical protein
VILQEVNVPMVSARAAQRFSASPAGQLLTGLTGIVKAAAIATIGTRPGGRPAGPASYAWVT